MANAYNQILTRGTASELNSLPISDGKIRLTTDTEQLYIDFQGSSTNKRIMISDFIIGYTESQIRALANPLENKFYLASDSSILLYYLNSVWHIVTTSGTTKTEYKDFVISTIWVANDDNDTKSKYPYKQLIESNLFDDDSFNTASLLAGDPTYTPTVLEEKNINYIRGFAKYDSNGITLLSAAETTVALTLRVYFDPTI